MGVVNVEVPELGSIFAELGDVTSADNKFVRYARLPSFRIECNQPMQMNLDGEPSRGNAFDFSVVPKALRFV